MAAIIRPFKMQRPYAFSTDNKKKSSKKILNCLNIEDTHISMSVNLSKKSTHRESNNRKLSRKMYLSPQKNGNEKAKNRSFFKKDSQQFWESIGGNLAFLEGQSLRELQKDNIFQSKDNSTLSVENQLPPYVFAQKTGKQCKKQCKELDHKFYSTTTVFVMKKNELNHRAIEKTNNNRGKRITSVSSPENPQFIKRNAFRTKQMYGKNNLQGKRQNFAADVSFSPSKQKNCMQNSHNLKQQCFTEEKIDAWNFHFEEDEIC